jgi:hypothetical protein
MQLCAAPWRARPGRFPGRPVIADDGMRRLSRLPRAPDTGGRDKGEAEQALLDKTLKDYWPVFTPWRL